MNLQKANQLGIQLPDQLEKARREVKEYFRMLHEQRVSSCSNVKEVVEGKKKYTYHVWMEDFVDEETGEIVSLERTELIAINDHPCNPKGRKLTFKL